MEGIASIPLNKIRAGKYNLRDSTAAGELSISIRKHGLLQPLTVNGSGVHYELVDGHKRLLALRQLKRKSAPAFILKKKSEKELFLNALLLNSMNHYSELDRCQALLKAVDMGFERAAIQNVVLPLLGLVPSSKVLQQYELSVKLPDKIKKLIRSGQLPFQGCFWLSRFNNQDQDYLIRNVFARIRPTASQLAHLAEWLLDLRRLKNQPIAVVLKQHHIKVKTKGDTRLMTDAFYRAVKSLRFPSWSERQKAFQSARDTIQSQPLGIEIRSPEHFEQEGFYLQAHVRNRESLRNILRHFEKVEERAAGLFDTVL